MDDLTKRYLRQQLEIGGREVVLGRDPGGGNPAESLAPRQQKSGRRPAQTPEPAGATTPAPATAKDWRIGAPPIPGPGITIPGGDRDPATSGQWSTLAQIAEAVARCRSCPLCQGRTNVVPGEGNPVARLVLVGEGPGQTEDETGRPFVGRAGELLTGILGAIGLARDEVFICNVVKCRPPQNRKPLPDEIGACDPYLQAQLELIRPKVILALGATAAEALLRAKRSLADLRGKVHSYRGTPLVVTYHPAALLRNPNWKKPTWDDVRIARQLLDA